MGTYIKTATIEAEQFIPEEGKIPSGVISNGHGDPRKNPNFDWVIETKEGLLGVSNRSWIATGIDGEKWAIQDDIFQRTYVEYKANQNTSDSQYQEIERLNAQVALLTDVLTGAEVSLCAFIGDEGWSQSDMDNMDAVSAAHPHVLNTFG